MNSQIIIVAVLSMQIDAGGELQQKVKNEGDIFSNRLRGWRNERPSSISSSYRIKFSKDLIKVSNPGILQIERQRDADGRIITDRLFGEGDEAGTKINPEKLLLRPIIIDGKPVGAPEALEDIQGPGPQELATVSEGWRRALGSRLHLVGKRMRDLLEKNRFQP